MKWPRWVHKFYAAVFRYFWLPCPNCGRMFGGHEKLGGGIYKGCGVYQGTCSRCKIGWPSMNDLAEAPFTAEQVRQVYRAEGLIDA